jgi:peptidoglycan/xylan/chitin deacetylase (PgdA/CDA1 family)
MRIFFTFCVAATTLVTGCTTPPADSPVPSAPAATSSAPPSPAAPTIVPDGWQLGDVPTFPPAPKAVPITLPADGSVPYLSRIETDQPVAFITIDDGMVKHPEAVKLLAAAKVPVTLFLTTDTIKDNVDYFKELERHGAVIEAHTITHTRLKGRPAAFQKHELCGSADLLGQWYGRRPVLFRPPFGDKDATTLTAAKECGMQAGFFWKETVHEGKVRYQQGSTVQRGDILLMHFRPAFPQDFLGALKAIHDAGLTPALLEDYLPASNLSARQVTPAG